MIGGYQILDLRGIDLQISASASNITDPYVLKQLLSLRDHIDKAYDFNKPLVNQLKPVLIRFRDKKNGEKTEGATFGEMSVVTNYYTFKITGRISGQFTLIINVAFHEITNEYGNKEWVINTAKIQLADASVVLEGDIAIDGDLSVSGDIEGDSISGNEIVEKMTGYSFENTDIENLTKEYIYSGVVKNGNKLTFALALNLTRTGSVSSTIPELGRFVIPASISSKLYPTSIGVYGSILGFIVIYGIASDDKKEISVIFDKQGTTKLQMLGAENTINSLTQNKKYFVRIEATFLLSDNLIPNE